MRSRFFLGSVMESRGLHILDCRYQGPNAESGGHHQQPTSSAPPALRGAWRAGEGCLLGTEGVRTPPPRLGQPPSSRSPPPPPPSCVWVSPFCASTPLRVLGPAESACLSESLTPSVSLSPCLGLVQLSVSVLGLSPCLPLSPSLCVSLGLWSLRSQPSSLSLSISAWVFLSLPFLSHLHLCLQAPAPCSSLFPPLFLSLVNSASYTPLSPPLARGDLEEEDPPPPPHHRLRVGSPGRHGVPQTPLPSSAELPHPILPVGTRPSLP